MQIEYLQYIVKLASCRTIAEAAELLYVQPSTLSSAIKAVEAEFNIQIFNRSRQGICLTTDGRAFLSQAEEICNIYDNMLCTFSKHSDNITLAINHIANDKYGVAIAGHFKAVTGSNSINAILNIMEFSRNSILQSVIDGKCDLGIGYVFDNEFEAFAKIAKTKQVSCQVLATDIRYLYLDERHYLANNDHIRISDLKDSHFAVTEKGLTELEKSKNNINVKNYTIFSNLQLVKQAIQKENMCAFLLSDHNPIDWFNRGTTIRKISVFDLEPEYAQHIILYREKSLSKNDKLLIKSIKHVFGNG